MILEVRCPEEGSRRESASIMVGQSPCRPGASLGLHSRAKEVRTWERRLCLGRRYPIARLQTGAPTYPDGLGWMWARRRSMIDGWAPTMGFKAGPSSSIPPVNTSVP